MTENTSDDTQHALSPATKEAVQRGELWEAMGFPTSKPVMPEEEYTREYQGRLWFCTRDVMEQAVRIMKLVLCPACIKMYPDHRVVGSRMYITIEDDVMSTFPAVGHFLCHNCGFEEWHPIWGGSHMYKPMQTKPPTREEYQRMYQALQNARTAK